uniref:Uncharacterized protein n=1 Tax=Arundo donax TaxID=35708 RepID=A0A0A8XQY0_ARUDO
MIKDKLAFSFMYNFVVISRGRVTAYRRVAYGSSVVMCSFRCALYFVIRPVGPCTLAMPLHDVIL